jgi:tRNA(fMet)-specific endonuclease VapC
VGRRLILDTSVLIAYERRVIDRWALEDGELAVAAITIAEYRTGIELADTPEPAAARARALAHVRRSGSPRGAHDLAIAAHVAKTGRLLLTRDAKARFSDLPGVTALDA